MSLFEAAKEWYEMREHLCWCCKGSGWIAYKQECPACHGRGVL